jgi:hypothetical protein
VRTPLEALRDHWRWVRRKPRRIVAIDREFAELSLTLAALLRSARGRGGVSEELDASILMALAHETVRVPLTRIPEGATTLAATIPPLATAAEFVSMGMGRMIWQQHTFHMAGLVRKVLLERDFPDPLEKEGRRP